MLLNRQDTVHMLTMGMSDFLFSLTLKSSMDPQGFDVRVVTALGKF